VSGLRHWLKFNAVGVIGVGVQLGSLAVFKTFLEVDYLAATLIAVEAAILHNFIWHERWTWNDRTRNQSGVLRRLLRFNMANGAISLGGNVAMMWLLVSQARLHYLLANLLAIAICSLANFFVSDRLVFQDSVHENHC